jgi:hypothetical protein
VGVRQPMLLEKGPGVLLKYGGERENAPIHWLHLKHARINDRA